MGANSLKDIIIYWDAYNIKLILSTFDTLQYLVRSMSYEIAFL
ncbi:MAG: hypothetical protein Gaeavirus4_22 [Gaeavirus sp.]|uniref:Uncharacterized protein n=1 Tax=Gaeavirus sp. TaxID=2487767 RepID=A0A3G5A3F5_9VIRU|nr:MAG: hypothetical protein Gaeavirus4_22 [Gaeavirus sp.]